MHNFPHVFGCNPDKNGHIGRVGEKKLCMEVARGAQATQPRILKEMFAITILNQLEKLWLPLCIIEA